jgi:hypothetical protein
MMRLRNTGYIWLYTGGVTEPHHFDAAPAQGKYFNAAAALDNYFNAAPAPGKDFNAAPAPMLLCGKPTFFKSTKLNIKIVTVYFYDLKIFKVCKKRV